MTSVKLLLLICAGFLVGCAGISTGSKASKTANPTITYRHDAPGRLARITPTDPTSSVVNSADTTKKVTRVDEKGDAVEISQFDADGHLLERQQFARSEKRQLITVVVLDGQGVTKLTENYLYDSKDRRVETVRALPGDIIWKRKEMYDDRGNLVKTVVFNPVGNVVPAETWPGDKL